MVLAKLWSVMPKLFTWPPARSVAHVLERLSLILIVGGIVFEMVTGLLNIQYDYIFGFSFYTAHYFGAWVFIVGFAVHVSLKFPTMVRSLRSRSLRTELRTSLAETRPEPAGRGRSGSLVAVRAHHQSAGSAGPGRGRVAAGRRPHRRSEHRRRRPECSTAHPPRALVRKRAERLPGQPNRGRRPDRPGRHRTRLEAVPRRWPGYR